jgi:hypothetical protein
VTVIDGGPDVPVVPEPGDHRPSEGLRDRLPPDPA